MTERLTTNQKVVGSNPAGRAILKSGLQRWLRSFFVFHEKENQGVYWAKLGKLTVWPVQLIVQMYDCLL